MAYEPRGKVRILIDAMKAEPGRIWTSPEVAQVMEVAQSQLTAHLDSAIRNQALYRKLESGRCQFSLQPFPAAGPAADPRAPQVVAGWVPPKMIAVRPGSEQADRPTAPGREIPPPPPPPTPATPAPTPAVTPAPGPRPTPAPTAAPQPASEEQGEQLEDEAAAEEGADEQLVPGVNCDAWFSCATGSMVLTGIGLDEDGQVTIPPKLVRSMHRLLTCLPVRGA